MCRSRGELSNAYFLAKFGFDAAENEPCQVQRAERRGSERRLSPRGIAITAAAASSCFWPHAAEEKPSCLRLDRKLHLQRLLLERRRFSSSEANNNAMILVKVMIQNDTT